MESISRGNVRVIPSPGTDEYLIEITASVDGLALAEARDKRQLIEEILASIIFPGLIDEILGRIALAKLVPKDRHAQLIRAFITKAIQEKRIISSGELDAYLKENGA